MDDTTLRSDVVKVASANFAGGSSVLMHASTIFVVFPFALSVAPTFTKHSSNWVAERSSRTSACVFSWANASDVMGAIARKADLYSRQPMHPLPLGAAVARLLFIASAHSVSC